MPTAEQALACVRVCQMLSDGYQPIHVFRYNPSTRTVFILAGVTESLEVVVFASGQWRFNDDETWLQPYVAPRTKRLRSGPPR
ncbi:hypothetical protein C7293_09190 [filamentous cyanobacterium CCT1]|nr:hypothetical protein C7293_09190 [filamentous cyanobacterium CCT1]PSN78578.1 hypothetical protein C8B47_16130 [filamentous cyanobacterium CCP4]